ncbi:hypothetical protein L218DRAFT_548629 [Marasmius fiardii PR-910]|nr:hypothetical protein L218DRAFT_548629 [Marasmius fiardii PR-910]
MSSSYPPQLHLTLPSNTTSFKRSFDQFGFDLESPVGNAEAGSSSGSPSSGSGSSRNGNKRQRPRSASSLSDGSDSLSSGSTFASGSSETRPSEASEPIAGPPALTSNRPISSNILGAMPFEPPRLPTPDIQDIEMPDYPLETQDETEDSDSESSSSGSSAEGAVLSSDEGYRSSHERLDDVERAPYGLLHPMPHIIPRPATPPPTLPPLALESDQTPLHQNVMPFLNDSSRSSSTLSNTTSDPGTLSSNTLHIPQASTSLPTESAISSHTLLTQGRQIRCSIL